MRFLAKGSQLQDWLWGQVCMGALRVNCRDIIYMYICIYIYICMASGTLGTGSGCSGYSFSECRTTTTVQSAAL